METLDYIFLGVILCYGVVAAVLIYFWPDKPEPRDELAFDIFLDLGGFNKTIYKAGMSLQEFGESMKKLTAIFQEVSETFRDANERITQYK